MLLNDGSFVLSWLPKIRSEVSVGLAKGIVSGLQEVTSGLGLSSGRGIDVLNTGKLEDLLGGRGSDESRTSGGGNQSDSDGS